MASLTSGSLHREVGDPVGRRSSGHYLRRRSSDWSQEETRHGRREERGGFRVARRASGVRWRSAGHAHGVRSKKPRRPSETRVETARRARGRQEVMVGGQSARNSIRRQRRRSIVIDHHLATVPSTFDRSLNPRLAFPSRIQPRPQLPSSTPRRRASASQPLSPLARRSSIDRTPRLADCRACSSHLRDRPTSSSGRSPCSVARRRASVDRNYNEDGLHAAAGSLDASSSSRGWPTRPRPFLGRSGTRTSPEALLSPCHSFQLMNMLGAHLLSLSVSVPLACRASLDCFRDQSDDTDCPSSRVGRLTRSWLARS